MFWIVRFLAISASGLLLASCSSDLPLTNPATLQAIPVYQLGPGDQVRINVYNEPGLSGDFTVASDGTISFPLLGSVEAAGHTAEELRASVGTSLNAGYLNNPSVAVQVTSFRPFYVMGEVERPGRYPVSDQVTLVRAIATAGGFTYRAKRSVVYLRRAGQPEIKLGLDTDVQIQPGDVIRIGERYF